jgi:FkbM family methyltransferase
LGTASVPLRAVKYVSRLRWKSQVVFDLLHRIGSLYTNRDTTIMTGAARGLRFNTGHAHNAGFIFGTYEPDVQRLYAQTLKPGMVVYDVGAHVGFLATLGARLVGPSGRVICFEPLPDNQKSLAHNIELNGLENVTLIPAALGDREGIASFAVGEDVAWGKLGDGGKTSISVHVHRLTEAAAVHELPKPDVIKIDIEGGETAMLAGAEELIRKYRPRLFIELHGTNVAVKQFLDRMGYSVRVLGSGDDILSANWNSFVVAIPE